MRVALLTYSTRPRGGVVHTLALAEALARAGADVEVWTLARGGDIGFFRTVDPRVRLRLVEFPVVDAETVGDRVLRSVAVLGSALRELAERAAGAAAVIHAQDCISANAALLAGLPLLRTVHHIDQFRTPELIACHERAIRQAHTHICVSSAVARELATQWGVRATVIPNGVDAARFTAAAGPQFAGLRARVHAKHGRFVLTVGGIEPRKGTVDLVAAMAGLPGVPLVIAGGETLFDYRDYRAMVLARADQLGVDLRLLGPVDHEELPVLVAAAAAFAFPSTREGFGLAAMEALAAGVPLVVRRIPVLAEVFGSAALAASTVQELTGALRRALDEPDPRRRDAGRALAQAHTWDAAATAHLRVYAGLEKAATLLT